MPLERDAHVGVVHARHENSIDQMRRQLAREFRAAGFDTPELDARILVGHALGLDHAALAARSDRKLTSGEADAMVALAARRLAREPVARILGVKEFWGLPLGLNAETLVPRPETETVVEAALNALDRVGRRTHALRVADIGTGTGALLLALLTELSLSYGVGTDVNATALRCARANAAALGLGPRTGFLVCNYGAALSGRFDLVVCNPPYVARGDISSLAPEVQAFDPLRALDGGPDGLDGYRALAADARRFLGPYGILVLELGAGQLGPVTTLFARVGLAPRTVRNDLNGVPRALEMAVTP